MANKQIQNYPEYVCTLSPEMVKKAEEELNEKPEWRARDVQALRDMVLANKALVCPTDDAFLLRFLRARKFDYDRAYQLLISYYTIRAENAEYLGDLRPSTYPEVLDSGVTIVLPRPDKHGRRLIYVRPGKWDPAAYPMLNILSTNIANIETVIQDEESQVNGVVVIADFSTMGMTHVKSFDRNYVRLMLSTLQDSFPLRFKGLHFTKEPTIFGYVWTIIKPFLKEKTKERMAFHGADMSNLHDAIGIENLPEDLGGKLPSAEVLAKNWAQELRKYESFFDKMRKYKIELPRNITNKTNDEKMVDCLVGTYRKLQVD